jgi:hypothetical protein
MSCEGCREHNVISDEVVWIGEHLGEILVDAIYQDTANLPTSKKLSTAFKCILNSMSSPYHEESKEDILKYSLDCCPLNECAKRTGLSRSVEMAYISLIALCRSLINSLAPDWELIQPCDDDTNIPIRKIVIANK